MSKQAALKKANRSPLSEYASLFSAYIDGRLKYGWQSIK
jgi:hypothetical protein